MDCPRCGNDLVVGHAKSDETIYYCERCRTVVAVRNDGKSYPKRMPKLTPKAALGFYKEANKTLAILTGKKRRK